MDEGWDPRSGSWEGVVERDPGPMTTAFRVLLAAVLLGGIAIGLAVSRISGTDTPTAAAVEEPEPSADVDAPRTGVSSAEDAEPDEARGAAAVVVEDPLILTATGQIGEVWPVTLIEVEGIHILYGSDQPPFGAPDSTGLQAWTSTDNASWHSIGTVIPAPAVVHSVVTTSRGVIAIGTADTDSPALFRSDDGRSWTATPLPLTDTDGSSLIPTAVAANDDAIVIVSGSGFARYERATRAITSAIPERFRPSADNGFALGASGEPFSVQVYGPLGIAIFAATGDELGLDDDVIDAYTGVHGEQHATIWSSTDAENWTSSTIENIQIQAVSTTDDGRFIAFGFGRDGEQTFTSRDGSTWTAAPTPSRVQIPAAGPVGWLASSHDRLATLLFSTDGQAWHQIDLGDALDRTSEWRFHPLAAGDGGVAAIATGFDATVFRNQPQSVLIERDGFTVAHDPMMSTLTITDDAGIEVFRGRTHTNRQHDAIVYDPDALAVTFLAESGDPLLTLSLNELWVANETSYRGIGPGDVRQLLLASPDGTAWHVTELSSNSGLHPSTHSIRIEETSVIVVLAAFQPTSFRAPSAPSVSTLTFAFP